MTTKDYDDIYDALAQQYGYKKAQRLINLINKPVETTNEQPYLVIRPYCTPQEVIVMAKSKEDAIKQCTSSFGFCGKTYAKLQKRRGILLWK